jgi:hypothetical protein
MQRLRMLLRTVRFFFYTATIEAWRETVRFHHVQAMLTKARESDGR